LTITKNFREYQGQKRELFLSIQEKRRVKAVKMKKIAQKERMDRLKQIRLKKDLKIEFRSVKVRQWVNMIMLVRTSEGIKTEIQVNFEVLKAFF